MFRFLYPEFLYLLLLVPLLSGIWIFNIWIRNKKINKAGDSSLVKGLIPEFSGFRLNLKIIIQIIAFVFGIIMLARPQFGSKIEEIKREGVEIIIALDVSNSMMAEDIQPNRLERAKQSISRLVDRLENDKIGLIVFAGDAYTQIPVTTDYVSAKMFLGSINPGIVPKQGTAISSAIELASNSFSPQMNESKAIIIITDGETHEKDPVKIAEDAAGKGIIIHTIGIGSSEGVPIPVILNSRKEYLKDHEGNTVITKLNETSLKDIAFATGGKYVRASNSNLGLNAIFQDISNMKQQELDGTLYSEYNDQFQIFAAVMLILLLIDFIFLERKNRVLRKIHVFELKI
ncbi:MAG: VWA domain-containing protein [Bacteroidales bacterium]|nr:VWA domain-containing protein [Bacteroidales bacterium]